MKFAKLLLEIEMTPRKPEGLIIDYNGLGNTIPDTFDFNVDDLEYFVTIEKLGYINGNLNSIAIDFMADNNTEFELTNQNKPLQILSHVLWCANYWIDRTGKERPNTRLHGIKFMAKQESVPFSRIRTWNHKPTSYINLV